MDDSDKKMAQFERELNLLDEQIKLSISELREDIDSNDSTDLNLHLKYGDIEALIAVLADQIDWQREHLKTYIKEDTKDELRITQKLAEMGKTLELLTDSVGFQKDKMKVMTDTLSEFGKTIAKLKQLPMIVKSTSIAKLEKSRKIQGGNLENLGKRVNKLHNTMRKRVKDLEDAIKKLES